MTPRRIEELVAAREHQCTRCGGIIGRGDNYTRSATPPWLLGDYSDGKWEIIKDCGCGHQIAA